MTTVINYFKNLEDAKSYAAGDVIFDFGDPDTTMYGIQSGEVEIYFNSKLLETVEAGGLLGERSFIDNNPHATRAVAKTDCQIAIIDREKFLFLVHETPAFALTVMKTMVQRSREMVMLAM